MNRFSRIEFRGFLNSWAILTTNLLRSANLLVSDVLRACSSSWEWVPSRKRKMAVVETIKLMAKRIASQASHRLRVDALIRSSSH